ncbi:MAG: MBOAT family protein, partial [Lachnospira eligens]
MLFTSYQFILFVLIALILYYVVPRGIQWIVLLCMNMLFYVYSGLSGVIFIVTTIVTTYAGAMFISREKSIFAQYIEEHKDDISKDEKKRFKALSVRKQKMFLTIVLFINFGILAVLKYTNMFIVTFTTFNTVDFILPMGISFYTFQSTGYMIDVYRGVADAERNPLRYALFVSFFPQLVQGPISRWNNLKK